MLNEKDKALTLIYKGEEKTSITTQVKEGFAVVEVKLQHCKEYQDNKDWLDKLKNGYNDDNDKTSKLYIKVESTENVFKVVNKGVFLKNEPFEMIGNNWHEPVDAPQIAIYNQHDIEKAKSNTFGTGRGRFHSGLDIFSLEGSNVYACLDAEVYEIQKWTSKTKSGYGHNIIIKVKNPQEVRNRKREYTKAFSTDLDEKSKFDENLNIFYLRYAHLEDILVKKGDRVKAGDIIGKSGVSGIALGTHDPHLHFNIYSDKKLESYLVNPAYYVYWKELGDLTETDKKTQKDRMKEKYKKNPVPKLSKLD